MTRYAVILAAAGKGTRFTGTRTASSFAEKKPFLPLAGKAVWLWSAERFARRPDVKQIILVTAPEDTGAVHTAFAQDLSRLQIDIVAGGAERFLSVENGLTAVRPEIDCVAIHDAARPCISDSVIDAVFRAAADSGAAIPAAPIVDTVKRSVPETEPPVIVRTESRDGLWGAQTPQVFRADLYRKAVAERGNTTPTDDAGLLERQGIPVRLVPGERTNIKITTPFDLKLAEAFLKLAGEL